LESIAYSGEVGVRQLIEDAYYSAHEDMRLSALTAMGRSADSRWRNLVRAELSNPSAAIRAEAAFAVGELEAKAALAEIVTLTGDEDATVRLAAIYALGHLGGHEARTVLRRISNSNETVEAAAADDALEEMAFYASDEAEAFPLYDEDEDDDEDEDWRFSSNPDLGVYN
jgi:HEAT repeat protein